MLKRKWISFLLSMLVMLFSIVGIVIGCNSYYQTNETKIYSHIKIGNLSFKIKKEKEIKELINEKGEVVSINDDLEQELTEDNQIVLSELFPGSTNELLIEIENVGTTKFDYKIIIHQDYENLFSITIKYNDYILESDNGEFNLGYLDVKDKSHFAIVIKMNQATSNEYQGKQIAFAVQVVATQVIE